MTGEFRKGEKMIWNVPADFFKGGHISALFSSQKFWKMDIVALSFVFDKYCPIID